MRGVLISGVVVTALALEPQALASCVTPRLFSSSSPENFAYVYRADVVAAWGGVYPEVMSGPMPTLSSAAVGVFWALGAGNPAPGVGIDSGTLPAVGYWLNDWVNGGDYYPYYIDGTWAGDVRIDGCIENAGSDPTLNDTDQCHHVLLNDDDGAGTGYFALVSAPASPPEWNYYLSPTGQIVLQPIPTPVVVGSPQPGPGAVLLDVALSSVPAGPSGGLYLTGCGTGAQGFRVYAQSVPEGGPPPSSRDLGQGWTPVGPETPVAEVAQGIGVGCSPGEDVYLSASLVFDSGFELRLGSANAGPVACAVCTDADADGRCAEVDCDDGDTDNWSSCASCADADLDGYHADCDRYVTIDGPDCDDGDTNNWPSCATCADADSDTYHTGCDRYQTLLGPDCDDASPFCTIDCSTCGPTRLNPPLPAGSNVTAYQVVADGTTVVYRADLDVTGQFQLYSVPITGGASTPLNGTLTAGASVQWFQVAGAGSRVTYCATETGSALKLHSVEAAGGPVTHFASSGGSCSSPFLQALSLDGIGARAAYSCAHVGGGGGGAWNPTAICITPVIGGSTLEFWPQVPLFDSVNLTYRNTRSADGRQVVYSYSPHHGAFTMKTFDVLDASHETLAFCAPAEGSCGAEVAFTRNSRWVVYRSIAQGSSVLSYKDFQVPATGYLSESHHGSSLVLSPEPYDGAYRVAYGASVQSSLRANHVGGNAGTQVTLVANGADMPLFSMDGSLVLYRQGGVLYTVPTTGGSPTQLSEGGSVVGARVTPDGSRVLYRQGTTKIELYSVPLAGPPSARVKLNGPLVAGGNVADPVLVTSDGSTVVYFADQRMDGIFELFTVPASGGTSLRVSHTLPDNSITDVTIAPGDRRLLYRARQPGESPLQLYSVELGTDGDADITLDATDCDPGDPLLQTLPEVGTLHVSQDAGGQTALEWTLTSPGGIGPITFDTLRAEQRDAFATVGSSVTVIDSDTDIASSDPDIPGTIFYYIVRAANACGSTAGPGAGAVNDSDGDGIVDGSDPCPHDAGASPADGDGDGAGDDCDVCPAVADPGQVDGDHDGSGDACDNCPTVPNRDQFDSNGDGWGEACLCENVDGDDLCVPYDNCPAVANPDQADGDGDGIGDACDDP